ncbi:acyltransferase [Flavobacterium zepuense]|uniref:Acyltransferase n=1 Tax=Flavobacterium zepuense TaxID=2593302 RepID=A0A552UWK9_9FLAO|nr:acyltransferase [Flavobacterium zepuense]TRW22589.1 acyltransferase [Flavobacterium zepuense]
MKIKLQHFNELDGVRAIAALMVMFFHFFKEFTATDKLLVLIQKVAIFGQTGVSLFFVLSGFLITRILINTKSTPNFFYNFYLRRTVRIFPLYYLFLIIYFFVVPALEHTQIVPFNEQIYFWVYLQNIGMTFNWNLSGPNHYWSLAVEEHFYMIWPLLVYYLSKKGIKIAIFGIIIMALITRILLINNGYGVFYFTFARVDELALGALLAIWEINERLKSENSKKFLLLALTALVPTILLWTVTGGKGLDIIQITKFILLALCYLGLIGWLITVNETNIIKKSLKHKWLSYTGKISYGLYVYHPLCFMLIKRHLQPDNILLYFVLCFVSAFILASMSYYLFESKFLHFKKYFEYNTSKQTV